MNKESLFRGKRVDNDEWVYGDLIHRQVWRTQLTIIRISDDGFDHYEEFEVKPETVGEFTNLTDKTSNKIFEGDIVKATTGIEGYKSTYHSTIQEVKYNAEMCGIAVFLPFDNSDMVEVEVIGNIYDNPELLHNGD